MKKEYVKHKYVSIQEHILQVLKLNPNATVDELENSFLSYNRFVDTSAINTALNNLMEQGKIKVAYTLNLK